MNIFRHYAQTPEAPNVLRLRPDGTLYCVDGSPPRARLRELYKLVARPGDADMPICILHREGYSSLAEDAFLTRHMVA